METTINGVTYTSKTTDGLTTLTHDTGSVMAHKDHNDIVRGIVLGSMRTQRDELLRGSDWRMTSDYPYSDQLDWIAYRQELRDLPSTYDDKDIKLPTKPQEK